jgi:hypothetical protein
MPMNFATNTASSGPKRARGIKHSSTKFLIRADWEALSSASVQVSDITSARGSRSPRRNQRSLSDFNFAKFWATFAM